ncbi:MAG: peptide-methionine (S)-S-oxide reductase MsrA [Lysobacterales bacterium]
MKNTQLPTAAEALVGRDDAMPVPEGHHLSAATMVPPFPDDTEAALFGMGCFWGAERRFWELAGVYSTQVGYAGGLTPNPTYQEVCTGHTGHAEVVRVVYFPAEIGFDQLLKVFWEAHDPTQGMGQGTDIGTQYRSVIFVDNDTHMQMARSSAERYETALISSGHGPITTEIGPVGVFYYAEEYHQQYLSKNASGYCGLAGTGVVAD